jgi:hypothetical protein
MVGLHGRPPHKKIKLKGCSSGQPFFDIRTCYFYMGDTGKEKRAGGFPRP